MANEWNFSQFGDNNHKMSSITSYRQRKRKKNEETKKTLKKCHCAKWEMWNETHFFHKMIMFSYTQLIHFLFRCCCCLSFVFNMVVVIARNGWFFFLVFFILKTNNDSHLNTQIALFTSISFRFPLSSLISSSNEYQFCFQKFMFFFSYHSLLFLR